MSTTPSPRLLALGQDIQPAEYALTSRGCTLGRSPSCDIVVSNRKEVSRLHAVVEPEGPRYVIRDHNSTNGTFINGARIRERQLLDDRDAIGLGLPTPLLRFADDDPTHVVAPRLSYDEGQMTFYLDGEPLQLTLQQFQLLSHLYQHAGQVCTRESCAQAIWGRDYDPGMDADALNRAISDLRAALRDVDPDAKLIQTRRGLGYALTT